MTDQPIPADFQMLVIEAMAEASRAMIKFPQPNYTISKFAEEAGEVVKAAIHHAEGREKRDAVVDEMRQALAMMLRLWIECARLQAFPDDWTQIPWRGRPAEACPDGPQYKALGNSMATVVVKYIMDRMRISMAEKGTAQ